MTSLISSSSIVRFDGENSSNKLPAYATDGRLDYTFRAKHDEDYPFQIDLGETQTVESLYLSQVESRNADIPTEIQINIYVSPVNIDDPNYSLTDHLCYNGDIEGVVQCDQTMSGRFIIIN